MSNFGRLDLNLLLTLDVLLAEQNVTRTAQRRNLSQPSVSVQLAKLREFFDDPLLLPGPRGMRPTARADELREPLRQALAALENAIIAGEVFDPSKANPTWTLGAADYGESTIVLPALRALRMAAPSARLSIFETSPARIIHKMEQGELDLAFHTSDAVINGLHSRFLFAERYVLVSRKGHPSVNGPVTLTEFCGLEHVMVSPDGGGFYGYTDTALAAAGLTRRVVLSVPHFLFVLQVLMTTDLVAMLPERLVRGNPALQITEAPLDVPGFDMFMVWHERAHRDPAHQWLREFIADSV
ncbi:LysR family transcriptional regulator [Rahnella sp. PD4]|uniref:LysR family transcriptional regulator n=1 Tax=Rahnella sp. PD4 TaxID=3368611 RepID=UPI003BA22E22